MYPSNRRIGKSAHNASGVNSRLDPASPTGDVIRPAPECVGDAETEISEGDTEALGGARGGRGAAPGSPCVDNPDGPPTPKGKAAADPDVGG